MTGERGFERERDWTQGPAKWAAVVVLGMACVLTSAWVMAGRVRIERQAVGAEIGRAGEAGPVPPLARPGEATKPPSTPAPAATPPTDIVTTGEPLGPEPIADAMVAPESAASDASAQPAPSSEPAPSIARRVNINTATTAELELLPGVGPKLAEKIVDYRKKHGAFKKIDDLDGVSGIGERILDRLRPLVTVE